MLTLIGTWVNKMLVFPLMEANGSTITVQDFKPRPGSRQLQEFTFQCYKMPIKIGIINK